MVLASTFGWILCLISAGLLHHEKKKKTQDFSKFISWGTLSHWLYFDGYCEVTSNSQDTSSGLCVGNYQDTCSDNWICWMLCLLRTGFYLILTQANHFMYFHSYCKVTSNFQYIFYWLCVVNHGEIISVSQFGWMLWLVSAGWLYHEWALLNDTCRNSVCSHHEVFSAIDCILTVTVK